MGSNADSIDIGFRAQQLAELDNTIEVNRQIATISHPIEGPLIFLISVLYRYISWLISAEQR